MNKRVVVLCKGLFIKKTNGRYREITSLEFLSIDNVDVKENETLNPIIIEDMIPKSLPGEAFKIFEQRLPSSLLDLKECFEPMLQENLKPFLYKGKYYIFIENILNQIITKKEA